MNRRLYAAAAGTAALALLAGRASAAVTYTVTNGTDNGLGTTAGTLSYAIAQADATSGATITFAPGLTLVTPERRDDAADHVGRYD